MSGYILRDTGVGIKDNTLEILRVISFDFDQAVHVLIVDLLLAKKGYIEDREPFGVHSLHVQFHFQLVLLFDATSLQITNMFLEIGINLRHVLISFNEFQVILVIFSNRCPDIV